MGIGPNQSAASQQDSSKIPSSYHYRVHHAGFFQGVDHRDARRALGLAIVGKTLDTVFPQDVSVHVVACVPVLGLEPVDKFQRFLLGLDRPAGADETGFLFDELVGGFFFHGDVFHSVPLSAVKTKTGGANRTAHPGAQGPLFSQ